LIDYLLVSVVPVAKWSCQPGLRAEQGYCRSAMWGRREASWRNDGGGRIGLESAWKWDWWREWQWSGRGWSGESLRVGVRSIVKVVGRGDLEDVADVSLIPASYESEAVGKQFGIREDWFW